MGHGRHLLALFRRQVIEVLVHGIAGMDLVLDTVDPGHQHRREAQVGVGGRVGEAQLDTLALGAGGVGNTDGSRTVAGTVGQHDRRLEARHQTLVGVGGRVGKGVQGTRMLDDAADVVERHLGEAGVLVTRELVDPLLPEGLVHMHAAAVVAHHRLGHEGSGLAVGVSHVVDHVLHLLDLVGLLDQGVELDPDLVLAGVGHLVVVHLDALADRLQGVTHGTANIVEAVHRWHREVATLDPRPVGQVAPLDMTIGSPGPLLGGDLVHRPFGVGLPVHLIEDEELGLRTKEGGVAHAGGLQVGLGALGDGARVAVIALHGGRLDDIAAQHQGRVFGEGVQEGGAILGPQDHVGLIDPLPARHGGAIEHLAVLEELLIDISRRNGDVLLLADGIGEAQVDPLDVMFFDQGERLGRHGVLRLSMAR